MKETAKIVEAAKAVAEVLVNHRITYAEVNRVFRETERHLSLAMEPETVRRPYERCRTVSILEADSEIIRAWREQTGWRRFQTSFHDMDAFKEMRDALDKHKLTQRELAVLLTTIRLGPGLTLADFHQDDEE